MATACPPSTLITSVQRALHLLRAAARTPGGASAKQLAQAVGLPIGTTYHLLRTLTVEGYLQRLANGCYVVGDEVASLLDQSRLQTLLQRCRPALTALRDVTGAPAYLAFHENREIVVKDVQDSPAAPRVDIWVGFREAAHATAFGKCVLAFLDPEQRHDYLARHPLHALTARTITTRQALVESLERIRTAGLATEDEEYLPGIGSVAIPILVNGLTGSVAVSVPRRRLAALDELVAPLMRTAERIERWSTLTL